MGKPPQTKKIKKLLTEAVTLLCRSSFSFADQVTVEGLLGITLDKRDILLISINETIKQTISRGVKAGRDFKSDESPSPKRKQSKKKRRRSTSSEGTEDSDEEQDMIGHVRDYNLPPGVIVGPDGQIHTTGQFHREAFHGEEPYGDSDTGQDDLEIKEEKLTDEEAECFMVEGEEEEDSKEGFIKGHPEMGYVQCGPAFSQAGPSNVHQFQGKGINQGQQPGQMTPQQQPPQIIKCNLCPKSFKWDHNLQKHMQEEHSGTKVHKCAWCDKVLSSDSGLKRHMKKIHGMTKEGEIKCQQCGKKITSLPCTFCASIEYRGEYGDEDYDEYDEGELEIPTGFPNQQVMQPQQQQMKFQQGPIMQPPHQQPQQQFMVQGKRQTKMPLQQQQQQGFIPQQQGFNPMMQQQQFRQGSPQQFGQMQRKMVPQQPQRMMMPRQQSTGFQQQFQQHLQRNPQQQVQFRGQMMQQPRQQLQMQRQGMKQGPQAQLSSSPLFIKPEPEWEEGQMFTGQQQQMQQFQQGQMQQPFQPPLGPQQGKKARHKVQYVPPMQTTQAMQSPKADKTKNEDDNYEDDDEVDEPKRKKSKRGRPKKRSPSQADSPASQNLVPPAVAEQKAPTPSDSSHEKSASQDGTAGVAVPEGSQDVGDMETYIKEEPEWEEP